MRGGLGIDTIGFLDQKECWKLWHSIGTLPKVRDHFSEIGKINPKTGNPPTISGIEKSAYAWAINHKEEARKDLAYSWKKEGQILDDEKWEKFLFKIARLVYHQRPKRFERFVYENGLQRFFDVE